MNLKTRIAILGEIKSRLDTGKSLYNQVCEEAYLQNNWFTRENIDLAISSLKNDYLNTEKLIEWTQRYDIKENCSDKKVGMIMAGNIPMVGIHDLLCVFISGLNSQIKLSSKDEVLMNYIIGLFHEIDPQTKNLITTVEKLNKIDAVIATGSNNSFRYFEYYFGKLPNILRRNRNSVAVLTGYETEQQLMELSFDIQSYFGLGCRNISKIYVPASYKFDTLIEILNQKTDLKYHNKYMNNYDYNLAVSLINKEDIMQGENILLIRNPSYISRIAVLNYEEYTDIGNIKETLSSDRDKFQLISSSDGNIGGLDFEIKFGSSQNPQLWDYADGVDTMKFLNGNSFS